MTELAAAGARVGAVLEDVFAAAATIGDAFAAQRRGCIAAGTALTADRLASLREIIWHQLSQLPAADGAGVVAAPDVIEGKRRHLEWWQRNAADGSAPDGYARIRLNLDPESIDLYDYLDMDWFTVPQRDGRRNVYGPYVDFSCANRYVITITAPVFDSTGFDSTGDGEREFLGVAGVDIRMSHLEPDLLAILRSVTAPAVLVTAERRVVAANTAHWISGTRLGRLPAAGDGTFAAVTDVGAGSGWRLAASSGLAAAEALGVEARRVLAHDLLAQLRGHRRRQCLGRGVEVPVRVVRGEHHPVRHLGELDRLDEVARVVWLLDRLGTQPEVLAEVFRRKPAQPGRVVARDRVGGIHRPLQRPRPR